MSTQEDNKATKKAPKAPKPAKEDTKQKGKDNAGSATAVVEPKSFARRDHLREIETRVQKEWYDSNIFEANFDPSKPKYFLNFPYPYMNGRFHMGHAFSLTKAEFTARYQRLLGKNVLFPFGFHCTGMPIQAAANKLRDEMAQFGNPPVFPTDADEGSAAASAAAAAPAVEVKEEKSSEAIIAAKSKGKKSKLEAKGQGAKKDKRQWQILQMMVPEEEIAAFADPDKWLSYFPPFGVQDLCAFGSAIDFRRSFITTAANPYYDAFIRWQFNRLREGQRIKFGKRPAVFSIRDGQVCADHDRSSGEGVGPQEYTIVKLLVETPYPAGSALLAQALVGKNVFLAPATLRPETMYGQTNCFVLPEGVYGCFETVTGDVLVMSHRAARGFAYQGQLISANSTPTSLLDVTGAELLGLPLQAPNSVYARVYTLPLLTISMSKGTGVVTSVPSDAPDDFVALRELKEKPLWREKFGLTAEMVEPFEVVPIIEIEGYGNKCAEFMVEKLDIKSAKDSDKLKAAKDEVYLKGFYEGVMLVGSCAGMKVFEAKPIVRQQLIDAGHALPYWEPESCVTSRSGDECIVALTDQWYLVYGAADWKDKVKQHIHSENFNGYNDKIMEKFDQVLDWLTEWACSRQFGLGTQLPWDDKWVIESLSDSTVYMAYYTIAHYFHGGPSNLSGCNGNPLGHAIDPADLTDAVLDFIFLGKPLQQAAPATLPQTLLDQMKAEFDYWYPFDLRVSAKDLIPNHLTMSLYNHAEIWRDQPEKWPRGIYCNGHIMIDAEKMSKSNGNFLMLKETVEKYSTDATRFALANAGDTMEDANFDTTVANQAVTYLYNEEEWIQQVAAEKKAGVLRTGELMFMDRCFLNEMDYLIEAAGVEFSAMRYRDGMCRGWFDFTIARDLYRDWATRCAIPMHVDVVDKYTRALVVMMSPVCPHWSENLYSVVGFSGSVCHASWPQYTPYNKLLRKQYQFFIDFLKTVRQANLKVSVAGPVKHAQIYVVSAFEPRKIALLEFMQSLATAGAPAESMFPADLLKQMKVFVEGRADLKPDTKVLMQFGAFMRDEALERGVEALATEMPFDQKAIIEENSTYLQKALDLAAVTCLNVEDVVSGAVPASDVSDRRKVDVANPGKPSVHFYAPAAAASSV